MSLADHLGKMGLECQYDEDGDRSYNALTLGMMCVGVRWVHTPSSILQQDLPSSLYSLLNMCISDEERRDHLKTIFERCAQEGGDSVYRPLLKVLTLGADELEAIAAFQRLGPDIALGPLPQELISIADLKAKKRQIEILKVLNILLLSDDVKLIQYKDCIKDLLAVLSSPDLSVQQEAKSLLIREARSNRTRAQEVKEELTLALSLSDPIIIRNVVEILERIGHEATKHLLNHLKSSEATNTMRVHIVKILGDVQDFSALPELHNRVAAASSALRTQVAIALCNYPMEKVVPELIEKVLHFSNDEAIAARNALVHFGRKGVELIVQHLFDKAKPSRVALLVQTLRSLEDERAVPYLIELMVRLRAQPPSFLAIEAVESLTINVVNALASFKSVFVVDALLNILNTWPLDTYKKVYTQASLGLSSQGEQALPTLLGALDVEKTEVSTEGVLHAIDMMKPFPEGALLNALGYRSDAQVRYIISIFVKRGKEEAPFLVQQLCHKNTRVQSCVHQILEQLDAEAVVEPLLEMLSDDVFRSAVIQHLRRYPDTVIPRLVELLGDAQLGETAVQVLIEFDVLVIERLRSLVRAFDDKNGGASLHAEQVFVELVKGHETLLLRVVELFRTITGDEHAYEALVHMLSTSLAYGSVPILLRELASKHPFMMRGVIDTLVRLGRENDEYSEGVICELIAALSVAEKRPQAEKALERIGERAVSHVEPLAIGKDLETRQSARNILSKMGPLAFGVLFSFLSSHDSERRSAAESIIANMETKDIKDPLLQLLSDQDVQRVEQSLVLLLGRIRADVRAPSGQQKMLTVLLEHIQTHESDRTTVLILNFLLLLPERKQLLETFNQVLSRYRRTQQWFMPLFLLMNIEGNEARANLLRLLQREAMTPTLEKEFVGILGMLEPNELVTKYATSIGDFAQLSGSPFLNNQVFQVERSRRAVGSLLASDYWNTERLQELQNREPVGSVRHELFTVLSGGSYVPAMLSLQEKLNEKVEALQKAEEDIAQLHRDVDQRDRQLRDANNQKATLKREKTSLSQEITNLREENASLRQENANLDHQ